MNNIGQTIKNKRKTLGISQVDFAIRTGIGLATIRDIEQEKNSVKLSSLFLVLNALGLTIEIKDK